MNENDILSILRRVPLTPAPASLDRRVLLRRRLWPSAAAAVFFAAILGFALQPPAPVLAKANGAEVQSGDELTTGPESRLTIEFLDGTVAKLNENSRLKVEEDRWQLRSGELWAQVAPRKVELAIETPSGTARIKGTEFNLRAGAARTHLAVSEGTVQLGAASVTAGQQAQIVPGEGAVVQRLINRDLLFRWARLQPSAPRHECEKPMFRREASEGSMGTLVAGDAPIALVAHRVDVTIEDDIATTTIEEVFYNTTDRRLEGTFIFPLPKDASISRFAMTISENNWMEGQIVEKERARAIYQEIVRRMTDPGLLEWLEGGNQFSTRIFPIEPKKDKRILISYTQALPVIDGRVRYVVPLVSDIPAPDRFELNVKIASHNAIDRFTCPSHHLNLAKATERSYQAQLQARGYKPQNDFVLEYSVLHRPTLSALRHGDIVSIRFRPDLPDRKREPGKYLFWIDSSRSMAGSLREIQLMLFENALKLLTPEDRFEVMSADSETRFLFNDYVPAAAENLDRAAAWLWAEEPLGASDIERALRALPKDVTLVYIGDGVPTQGQRDTNELVKIGVPAKRFFAIALGNSIQGQLLDRLGAAVLTLTPGESLSEKVAQLPGLLFRPVARNFRPSIDGARHAYPAEFPAIVRGEERVIYAVVDGERFTFEGREIVKSSLPVNPRVERLWAQRHVQHLVARNEKDAAIALSEAYGIMTPYTSFLVLETEADYEKHGIKIRRHHTADAAPQNWEKAIEDFRLRRELAQRHEWEKRLDEFLEKHRITTAEAERLAGQHYQMAERFFQEGKLENAEFQCRKALEFSPFHAGARALLYEIQILMGRGGATPQSEQRIVAGLRAQGVKPQDDIDGLLDEATMLYKQGRHEQAYTMFEQAAARRPNADHVYAWLKRTGEDSIYGMINDPDRRTQDLGRRILNLGRASENFSVNASAARDLVQHLRGSESWDVGRTPIATLSIEARTLLEAEQFDACINLCSKILEARPELTEFTGLKTRAERLKQLKERSPGDFLREVETTDGFFNPLKNPDLQVRADHRDRVAMLPPFHEQAKRLREELHVVLAHPLSTADERERAAHQLSMLNEQLRRLGKSNPEPEFAAAGLPIVNDPVSGRLRLVAPFDDALIEWPVLDTWLEISKRRPRTTRFEVEGELPEGDRAIADKLKAMKFTFDFPDTPLKEVVDFLRNSTGLNFVFDKSVEDPAGKNVTIKVQDISVEALLRYVLTPYELAFYVDGGLVIIATRAAFEARTHCLEIYDVPAFLKVSAIADRLRALIPMADGESVTTDSGRLIVRCAGEKQRAVAAYLRSIQDAVDPLSRPVSVSYRQEPLEDVLRSLCEIAGIRIVLDPSLKSARDLKITYAASEARFSSVLSAVGSMIPNAVILFRKDEWIVLHRFAPSLVDQYLSTLERGSLAEQREAVRKLVEAANADVPVELALRAMDAVTRFAPGNADHWFLLGKLYGKAGKYSQARRAILTPLEFTPDAVDVRRRLALELVRIDVERRDWDAAFQSCGRLLDVDYDAAHRELKAIYTAMLDSGAMKPDQVRERIRDRRLFGLLFPEVQIRLAWKAKVDLDLWVYAPGQPVCNYTQMATPNGAKLNADIRDGSQSERYILPVLEEGAWKIQVNFYTEAPAASGEVEITLFETSSKAVRKTVPFAVTSASRLVTIFEGNLSDLR